MEALENTFRLAIAEALKDCDPQILPRVCKRIASQEGYREVEGAIIQMVAKEGLDIGPAIAQLEVTL